MTSSFISKLKAAIAANNSLLCVGLDPDPRKYPAHFPAEINAVALLAWGQNIINQTADLVCCYKPNIAFYEQYGPAGLEALRQTIAAVPKEIPVLLDAKRGDIGSTATAYARAVFEVLQADAVTLSPYLGQDSIAPFVAYPGKTAFVLCYTSNPSAQAIQEFSHAETRLFEHIAQQAQSWGSAEQIAFVVGATQPHALSDFRRISDEHWILAPGIGAQGGDLATALQAGLNSHGEGVIVPVSRSVIYADDPRQAAQTLRNDINAHRKEAILPTPSPHNKLITLLYEAGCIQFGDFTLASGKKSPIYIDLRRMTANPHLLKLAAQAYARLLRPFAFDHLAGVPYAALPIGTAIALEMDKPLIYPRKEAKAYGTGKTVEGVFSAGDKVAVIEDLVTSGGSVIKAINSLTEAGLKVQDVAVLIDREQGGRENLAEQGYRLHSALKISEIITVLQRQGHLSAQQADGVRSYLNEQ